MHIKQPNNNDKELYYEFWRTSVEPWYNQKGGCLWCRWGIHFPWHQNWGFHLAQREIHSFLHFKPLCTHRTNLAVIPYLIFPLWWRLKACFEVFMRTSIKSMCMGVEQVCSKPRNLHMQLCHSCEAMLSWLTQHVFWWR